MCGGGGGGGGGGGRGGHCILNELHAICQPQHAPSIGVGRCSDLGGGGGGATFFLNNKNVISLRNNAYMQYGLQYCNEVRYVNSG